ncbi:MAG: T9SS type A sorting domain-containing protein [Chitinophagales bacterium]|nr:T9SS type A sorting domain-containing protein [Chitinophagales bacterium]
MIFNTLPSFQQTLSLFSNDSLKKIKLHTYCAIYLIFFLVSGEVNSQSPLDPCNTADLTFDSPPGTTLCSQNEGIVYDISIGIGSPYVYSSSLPTLPANPKIRIVGSFIIDTDLELQGATIQVAPDSYILLSDGTTTPTNGIGNLTLDNCDVFSCSGLWDGIFMLRGNTIKTSNGTRIEDAKGAIQAHNTQNCTLDILNTIFDRNDKAIWLENNPNDLNKPLFLNLSGNTFTCNAPLNGTLNGVSQAGIHLKDVSLITFPSTVNIFRELQNGIYAEGTSCNIATRKLYMHRIKSIGIFLQIGNLILTDCDFYDNRSYSIYVETAKFFNVNYTDFLITPALPANPNSNHIFFGIYLKSFALNANININHISFKADCQNSSEKKVTGILLNGGNVGSGTRINIKNNLFSVLANQSEGVKMKGIFPLGSHTEVWLNDFRVSPVTSNVSGFTPSGFIATDGDKNNLSIKWNRFTGGMTATPFGTGLCLRKSAGINNEVSTNAFNDDIESCNFYTWVEEFQNTIFCSNNLTTRYYGGQMLFNKANPGTKLLANTLSGSMLNLFGQNVSIGAQVSSDFTHGNKWFDVKLPNGLVVNPPFYVQCETGDPSLSKFSVHTPQSTCMNFNTNPGCYFSPYYPTKINPNDPIDGLFDIVNLPPSEGCSQYSFGIDELDYRITQDSFNSVDYPSMQWNLERYLYEKLKETPILTNEIPSLGSFMTNKENTSIGKLYSIKKLFQQASEPELSIKAQSSLAIEKINLLTDSLFQIEEQFAGYIGESQAFQDLKQKLINQLSYWDSLHTSKYMEYKSQMIIKLQPVFLLNESLPAIDQYEINEKVVNSILLISLMQQDGKFTPNQMATLESIARQDQKHGGTAVYYASGLLPDCITSDIPQEQLYPTVDSLQKVLPTDDRALKTDTFYKSSIEVMPNPTNNVFTVRGEWEGNCVLYLYDLYGHILIEKQFDGKEVISQLETDTLPGIYIIRVVTDEGFSFITKLNFNSK